MLPKIEKNQINKKINKYSELKKNENDKCCIGCGYDGLGCLDKNDLYEMCNELYDKMKGVEESTKIELINLINDKLKGCENDHFCWLYKLSKKNRNLLTKLNKFAPQGPNKKNEWLSNFDIINVFEQVTKKIKNFKFYNAVPRDFSKYNYEINEIDLNEMEKNNITKIGIIFNLDKRNQGGSHWTALYADLSKNYVFYYDSVGEKPYPEFTELMKKFIFYYKKKNANKDGQNLLGNGMECKAFYNNIQHQKKNSECGVYSINFLMRMIENNNYISFCKNIVCDDHVETLRLNMFNFNKYFKYE